MITVAHNHNPLKVHIYSNDEELMYFNDLGMKRKVRLCPEHSQFEPVDWYPARLPLSTGIISYGGVINR